MPFQYPNIGPVCNKLSSFVRFHKFCYAVYHLHLCLGMISFWLLLWLAVHSELHCAVSMYLHIFLFPQLLIFSIIPLSSEKVHDIILFFLMCGDMLNGRSCGLSLIKFHTLMKRMYILQMWDEMLYWYWLSTFVL